MLDDIVHYYLLLHPILFTLLHPDLHKRMAAPTSCQTLFSRAILYEYSVQLLL